MPDSVQCRDYPLLSQEPFGCGAGVSERECEHLIQKGHDGKCGSARILEGLHLDPNTNRVAPGIRNTQTARQIRSMTQTNATDSPA
jgi:hypothetical protein